MDAESARVSYSGTASEAPPRYLPPTDSTRPASSSALLFSVPLTRVLAKSLTENEIPHIKIETEMMPTSIEQVRTRLQAFVEMLKEKKNG